MSSRTTNKTLAILLAVVTFLAAVPSRDEKRISIYSTVATYSLPVLDHNGREYVGLLEILEPLGRVTARLDGQHWRLRFNQVDGDFVSGRSRVKVRGRDLDLPAPFLIQNSRGLVPLASLSTLLPRFLGMPVNFHESARRLFVGDIATQATAHLEATNPARLVLNFSTPVNPTISTEPGKLHMIFTRDPLVPPGSQSLSFDNTAISQLSYSESNGTADLTITGNAPLMASFSNNGRTITVAAAAQSAAAPGSSTAPAVPAAPGAPANPPQPQPQPQTPAAVPSRPLAVVDPAHGGSERGAALTDTLAEKNVTLGFARLLRHELEIRGFSVLLLRDADTALTLDQRAGTANASRAAVFVTLHAATQGSGVRVYTDLLPVENDSKGVMRAWNAAQAPVLPISQGLAQAIVAALQKRQFPVRGFSASLRPLNNVLMPAIAVELAPGPAGVSDLPSATYQQKVAAAVADGIVSMRDRLGARP